MDISSKRFKNAAFPPSTLQRDRSGTIGMAAPLFEAGIHIATREYRAAPQKFPF
ncbi:hypothetical protein [Mesorhizobium sp. CN2-181]|uniref:hypothetical protein n=1 Tax=Mesorhizobium yinganensis TaxID=3157707 RepID=UPI0032B7D8EB